MGQLINYSWRHRHWSQRIEPFFLQNTSCDVTWRQCVGFSKNIFGSIYVYDISILWIFQVNLIIFDQVLAACRFSLILHILAFSGTLMAVFSWKMFGLTQNFYRFKILVRGTCSDSFCENLSRWRHIRTPDVICHGEKSIWNKCWRQQKWVKVGNSFFDFQNLWSHTFLTNWYPGQINKPFKCY